jgi:hypothetical protein
MDKENEHIKTLSVARERLVAERRDLARELAKPYVRQKTVECRERFITIQNLIGSIDRAIADESKPQAP